MSNATKRFAEMTEAELYSAWLITNPSQGFAALRDAILAERDAEHADKLRDVEAAMHTYRTRAERAEQEAVQAVRDAALSDLAKKAMERALRTAEQDRDALNEESVKNAEIIESLTKLAQEKSAKLRTAESALGEARREGAREALERVRQMCVKSQFRAAGNEKWRSVADAEDIREFRDREYPATPSGEVVNTEALGRGLSIGDFPATPQPKATGSVGQSVRLYLAIDGAYQVVEFFAEDARRLLALAQTTTEGR